MKKIEIISRHCNFSKFSEGRERVKGFSKIKCYNNLKNTINSELANITFLMDGDTDKHFLANEKDFVVKKIKGGSQAKSMESMLDYVNNLPFDNDQIIYFIEDDYLHLENWNDILLEGFKLNVEYVSLYDHLDKYKLPQYKELKSQIFVTKSCHWRTVPSTTFTFGVKFKTFKKHFQIYKKYNSVETGTTNDHQMFLELWRNGSSLISSIPSYSSHMDLHWLAPNINWEEIIKKEK